MKTTDSRRFKTLALITTTTAITLFFLYVTAVTFYNMGFQTGVSSILQFLNQHTVQGDSSAQRM